MDLFVTCGSHLEELLKQELSKLGYDDLKIGFRGVYTKVSSFKDIYRINYCSRIASRVLLPLMHFPCRNREDLYQKISQINWQPYLSKSKTIAIDANVDSIQIKNSLFASQVVKDAICDQMIAKVGSRPSVNTLEPDLQLNLFLRNNKATISLDTSGAPLHKRGYRQEGGEAPLKETLAAALLSMANYCSDEILIDPTCGSGTFLIEAALMASNTPPGIFRKKWGFFNHPNFKENEWLTLKIEEDKKQIPLKRNHFFGIEINKNMQRLALSNFKATGFHTYISVVQGDFETFEPSIPPTFLIANPPYGKRLEDEHTLVNLYRNLGHFMKRKMAKPSRGFILTGSQMLSKEIGLASKKKNPIDNGGINAYLLEFDIY